MSRGGGQGLQNALASGAGGPALVEVEGVDFSYGGPPVLSGVTLAVRRGDFACLIGPNGGGKSTLMKLMLGLLKPGRGAVRLLGRDPIHTRGRIGYMPQSASFDLDFPISVLDVVLMGRLGRGLRLGPWGRADREAAGAALAEVGLDGLGGRPFAALSGGQRQRVLIARALAVEPDVLMLDEPTSNVDITAEEQIYALLEQLNQRLTIVMVSHDVGYVSRAVRTAVCVNRTVHVHTPGELDNEAIRRLYGREVRTVHAGAAAGRSPAVAAPAPAAEHCECGHDHPAGVPHPSAAEITGASAPGPDGETQRTSPTGIQH